MDPVAYKELHESFMKNNNGTTIEDAFITIIPTFFTTFIATNLILLAQPLDTLTTFVIEFVVIVFSMILSVTVLHDRIWEIVSTLLLVTITAVAKQLYYKFHIAPFVQIPCRRPEYLSAIRAFSNLLTAVCILAVDFKCFPRKLAKTETFGFGVMDAGVGLFVYINGVIAPELYKSDADRRLTGTKLKSTMLSCLPLLVLGIVRFFTINELDYQQHISEYGVHWNFFLTLAFTKVIGTIIVCLLPHMEYTKYAALVLVTLHELLLQLGLSNYVIDSGNNIKRDNFLNANREGIFSILGYVSIYLASVYIGYVLRSDKNTPDEIKTDGQNKTDANNKTHINVRPLFMKSIHLFLIAAVLWKITYILRNMFGVSRRLANMGYVMWIMAMGTTIIALFILLEIFHYFAAFEQPKNDSDANENTTDERYVYIPLILKGISYNGLAFFLAANLLTGFVNLIFQTILIDATGALLILCSYMILLCAISTFLYLNKIKLKAW